MSITSVASREKSRKKCPKKATSTQNFSILKKFRYFDFAAFVIDFAINTIAHRRMCRPAP